VLVQTNGAEQMTVATTRRRNRIRLSAGARLTNLTSQGLLKILRRTGNAIRDDGRWYVDRSIIDQIGTARRVLGIARTKGAKRKEMPLFGGRPLFVTSRSGGAGVRRRAATVRRVSEPKRRCTSEALASNQPDESLRPPQLVPPESPA
jgi:hypothetical protein